MVPPGLVVAVSLVSLVACGELNDAGYRGDERFRVEGHIDSLAPLTAGGASYATLSWQSTQLDREGMYTSAAAADIDSIEFPAPFLLRVFDLPDETRWIVWEGRRPEVAGVIALGNILVFEDVDGDQQYDLDIDAVRGATTSAVVYARELSDGIRAEIEANGWPFTNPDALVAGFQLGRINVEQTVELAADATVPRDVVITTYEPPASEP